MKIGDKVKYKSSVLNLSSMKRRDIVYSGTIYRIDKNKIAFLPDSWAKEGKICGLLIDPKEVIY